MTTTKKYTTRGAVVDAVMRSYLESQRMRRGGAPRAIVRRLFLELRKAIDTPSEDRGFTLEELADQTKNRLNESPSEEAVKVILETFEENLFPFREGIEGSRIVIAGTPHRMVLVGPTAATRDDDDIDRYWLRADFSPLAEVPAGSPPRDAALSKRAFSVEVESLVRRCSIFRGAFTADQAAFVLDLTNERLASLAMGGALDVDPASGRYSVRPDLYRTARIALLSRDDEFTTVASLHCAYFAYLNYRRTRGEVTEFTQVDLQHMTDAKQYLAPEFDEQTLFFDFGNSIVKGPRPSLLDSIMKHCASRAAGVGAYEAATRVYALLASFSLLDKLVEQYESALIAFDRFVALVWSIDGDMAERCRKSFELKVQMAGLENLGRYLATDAAQELLRPRTDGDEERSED